MEFLTFLIVQITIVGLSFAGYKEWLKFRAKQHKCGLPSEVEEQLPSLRDRLAEVERDRNALRSPVQNLVSIVTSEAWDPLQDASFDTDAVDTTSSQALESPSSDEASTANRALARQLPP